MTSSNHIGITTTHRRGKLDGVWEWTDEITEQDILDMRDHYIEMVNDAAADLLDHIRESSNGRTKVFET